MASLKMKTFERIVKNKILDMTQDRLDPLQFAYKARRGVEDATATLLNLVLRHLEGNKKHARLLFIDFSSAFNCIQPHIFAHRLLSNFYLDFNIVCWLIDFLTNREQRIRVNGSLSSTLNFYRVSSGLLSFPTFICLVYN